MDSSFRRISRLLFALLAYRPPRTEVPPQGAILAGVTVVNPGLDRRTDQTLVVSGDRITSISAGPAAPDPPDAGRYRGAYVLPGLIEMHIHFPPPERELAHLLLLAHGVTSAREAGDADGTTWPARRRIQAGRIPGPRLFVCGPVLDGSPPYLPTSWVVRNAVEAEAAVNAVADLGADFIKVHHKLSAEALAGIRAAAERRGLRVAGHVPMAVRFEDARLWDVQHLDGLVPYARSAEAIRAVHHTWRCLDPDRVDAYVRTSAEQGLVHTPTLASFEAFARLAAPAPALTVAAQWLPRYYRAVVWSLDGAMRMFAPFVQEPPEALWQEVEQAQRVVARLHRAGVRLHLGTDAPGMPYLVPGASLHEELRLFVGAGLSPEAAWEAGTRAAGASLGVPGLGTVAPGALADLLVFAEDPTRDLGALGSLRAVIAAGRLYPGEALHAAMARHRAAFEQPLYDRLATALMRQGVRFMR